MAMTNHERVGKALNLLRDSIRPFAERGLKSQYRRRGAQPRQVRGLPARGARHLPEIGAAGQGCSSRSGGQGERSGGN